MNYCSLLIFVLICGKSGITNFIVLLPGLFHLIYIFVLCLVQARAQPFWVAEWQTVQVAQLWQRDRASSAILSGWVI